MITTFNSLVIVYGVFLVTVSLLITLVDNAKNKPQFNRDHPDTLSKGISIGLVISLIMFLCLLLTYSPN